MDIELRSRFAVDDAVLSELHARAFDGPLLHQPWAERLARYAVSWVGAFEAGEPAAGAGRLVGFVQACGDGGAHAFLLDTVVDPPLQRRGVGARLVQQLVIDVRTAGCTWLHVDYEPPLESFYRSCGFGPTAAGLLRL